MDDDPAVCGKLRHEKGLNTVISNGVSIPSTHGLLHESCCTVMDINVAKNNRVLLSVLVMAITMTRHQMEGKKWKGKTVPVGLPIEIVDAQNLILNLTTLDFPSDIPMMCE